MSRTIAADPRAWRATTVDESSRWYHALSERALAALDRELRGWEPASRPVTELRASSELLAALKVDLTPVVDALEHGRGFAIITPGAPGRYSAPQLTAIYWLIGQALGRPFEQNVQGTLLYDVKDTGQDVRYGARFSVTNSESTFHTDNSFGDDVLDYVGLLCLNTAKSGGLSQLVSAISVRDELKNQHPQALAELVKPFHVDRRGGARPGDEPTVRIPVLAGDENDLLIRYLRYWIEVGQEKAGQPLSDDQKAALDALDRVAAERSLRVEFAMKPGDMLFINNRWLLHNRTGFEDHAEPDKRRHYVRLWVRRVE